MIGNALTEIGNNIFIVWVLFAAWQCFHWRRIGLSHDSNKLIFGWKLIFTAVFFRLGWWSLALKMAPAGSTYHPWFIEWKWAVTIPAAILFGLGMLCFIDVMENYTMAEKGVLFFCSIALSTIIYLV